MKRLFSLIVVVLGALSNVGGQVPVVAQSGTAQYSITDLGTLGAYPHARQLNNVGQIVGDSRLAPDGATHATLYIPGLGINDLGVLPEGHLSVATGINQAGQVTGVAANSAGIYRGFLWTPGGGMTDIGSLAPGFWVSPSRINSSGEICGSAWAADTKYHAFVWKPAVGITDLGTLGGESSYCADLNDSGQAAGMAATADGSMHAVRYEPGTNGAPGTLHDLGTLGGWGSFASAINSAGVIVGRSYTNSSVETAFYDVPGAGMTAISIGASSAAAIINDAGTIAGIHAIGTNWWEYQFHGFIYQIGSATGPVDMGTLGGKYSSPTAINKHGVVVGRSTIASGGEHAFIYSDGILTDLNTLIPADSGVTLTEADDINDQGWILAQGRLPNGEYRSYLLKPGPFFDFDGFLAPISNLPVVNVSKAGASVPVKFSLGGNYGLDVVSSATSVPTVCDSTAPVDTIAETSSAGSSTLTYDPATGTYKYTWKTDKAWTGCRYFLLTLSDGNTYSAKFQFAR